MIPIKNFSTVEGDSGILLEFPPPTGLSQQPIYLVSFDCPMVLPDTFTSNVSFEPSAGYEVYGDSNFIPTTIVKIRSVKKIQTKNLIRLHIKDRYNNILYTDYILIICSPQEVIKITGRLNNATMGNVGPNGYSTIDIIGDDQTSNNFVIGASVTGPGIPTTGNISVASIITDQRFELSSVMSPSSLPGGAWEGSYTVSLSTACINPDKLLESVSSIVYTILDSANNWTYKIKGQIIAQFIKKSNINNDIVIFLPVKNTALLADPDVPSPIPAITSIKAGGRVRGGYCIS